MIELKVLLRLYTGSDIISMFSVYSDIATATLDLQYIVQLYHQKSSLQDRKNFLSTNGGLLVTVHKGTWELINGRILPPGTTIANLPIG